VETRGAGVDGAETLGGGETDGAGTLGTGTDGVDTLGVDTDGVDTLGTGAAGSEMLGVVTDGTETLGMLTWGTATTAGGSSGGTEPAGAAPPQRPATVARTTTTRARPMRLRLSGAVASRGGVACMPTPIPPIPALIRAGSACAAEALLLAANLPLRRIVRRRLLRSRFQAGSQRSGTPVPALVVVASQHLLVRSTSPVEERPWQQEP
jgi:hypothetical protein